MQIENEIQREPKNFENIIQRSTNRMTIAILFMGLICSLAIYFEYDIKAYLYGEEALQTPSIQTKALKSEEGYFVLVPKDLAPTKRLNNYYVTKDPKTEDVIISDDPIYP